MRHGSLLSDFATRVFGGACCNLKQKASWAMETQRELDQAITRKRSAIRLIS